MLELGAVSPFYARMLLGLLVDQGLLKVQNVAGRAGSAGGAGGKGGGALAACFRRAAQPQPSTLRCYFLTPLSFE